MVNQVISVIAVFHPLVNFPHSPFHLLQSALRCDERIFIIIAVDLSTFVQLLQRIMFVEHLSTATMLSTVPSRLGFNFNPPMAHGISCQSLCHNRTWCWKPSMSKPAWSNANPFDFIFVIDLIQLSRDIIVGCDHIRNGFHCQWSSQKWVASHCSRIHASRKYN